MVISRTGRTREEIEGRNEHSRHITCSRRGETLPGISWPKGLRTATYLSFSRNGWKGGQTMGFLM